LLICLRGVWYEKRKLVWLGLNNRRQRLCLIGNTTNYSTYGGVMNKETIEAIATKVYWDLIPALESGSSRAILVEIVTKVLEAYEAKHIRHVPKMVEGIDYTKSCGNVFEDLGIIPTSANKITFTLPICEATPVTVRSGSNKIIFHITPAGEFILGEGAVMSEAAKIFADEVNRFIKQPMGEK